MSKRTQAFSLLEVLISLTILMIVMGALLLGMSRMEIMTDQQTAVSDTQQAVRAAHDEALRVLRMAGRGGLQQDRGAQGPAILVRNNVGIDGVPVEVATGGTAPPKALEGTDILTVRGVMTNDLVAVNYRDPATWSFAGGVGTLKVSRSTPTGLSQDLEALVYANNNNIKEAILLIDSVDASTYGVGQLIPSGTIADADQEITLQIDVANDYGPAYALLSRDFDGNGAFPDLNSVAFVGVLEEYRYYVRDDEDLGPTLSRARVYPNTEDPWNGDDEELEVDFANGVADFQVALAFDSSNGGSIDDDTNATDADDEIIENDRDDSTPDDWLYNQISDDATEELWAGPWAPDGSAIRPKLFAVRVSTLSMAATVERGHPSPILDGLEDRAYENDSDDPINGHPNLLKRKRILQTMVKPRNL